VRPTCSILVNPLNPAWNKFGTIGIIQVQGIRSGVVHLASRSSFRMSGEIPQNRLDELVVRRNGHGYSEYVCSCV
jgi:hypothetical protein